MNNLFLILLGLAIALGGASLTARCKHRRAGKLPEDIQ